MSKIYYELDHDTGEIKPTEDVVVALQEGDVVRRKKQIDHAVMDYRAKNENGAFVWLIFKYGEELFPNISSANLTRLIYASTFCNGNGSLMSKRDLVEKMGLNRARWSEFWNEMVENEILYEDNKTIFVNPKYIAKGKMESDNNYTRLFCSYIQQLYEGCKSASDHKQLSYLFKIIPFVNRRSNIVCYNPMEQDQSKIQSMRLGDFCETIGYDRSQARRLAKELLKIRIDGKLAVGFFVSDLDEKTWRMIVNPQLYFGGKYDKLFYDSKALFIQESKEYKEEKA